MACGFNGARLHQKVFEPRFLYWADRLGYLVWGEYPNSGYNNRRRSFAEVTKEWIEILERDRNHPSIIGWCPFNENSANPGAAAELQQMVWTLTKAIDPTRPAIETSGWIHTLPHPEVLDAHDYTSDPAQLREKWERFFNAPPEGPYPPRRYFNPALSKTDKGTPFMLSEVGGIGWATEDSWAYGKGPKTLEAFYERYQGIVDAMLDNPNLFGFCYTQLTDIEQERNGLYDYDRSPKFDLKRLHAITSREAAYEKNIPQAPQPEVRRLDAAWEVLIGAVQDGKHASPYRYLIGKPGEHWMKEGFDDGDWATGLAPFASDERKRSEWKDGEIFCRTSFEFDGRDLQHAALVMSNNGPTDVWLNGRMILSAEATRDYKMHVLSDVVRETLRKGSNTLALRAGKQRHTAYLDLALLVSNR